MVLYVLHDKINLHYANTKTFIYEQLSEIKRYMHISLSSLKNKVAKKMCTCLNSW